MIRSAHLSKCRARILYLFVFSFLGVLGKLYYIQVYQHDYYASLASKQHHMRYKVLEARGSFYDCEGRVLAETHKVKSLWSDPGMVDVVKLEKFIKMHADELGMSGKEIRQICLKGGTRFVWMKRFLKWSESNRLAEIIKGTPGVYLRDEWVRRYPLGKHLSPLIGLVGLEGHGLMGLESFYERDLRGLSGEKIVVRDARQRMVSLRPKVGKPGCDVWLTIDSSIQTFLAKAMLSGVEKYKPKSATGLVMDVQTGAILAMVTLPAHQPGEAITKKLSGLQARAVVDSFEPGSTMKPLIYAALIENGQIDPLEKVDCGPGRKRVGPRVLHDVHAHGVLTMEDVVVLSSNIGAAQMGMRLGNKRMYRYLKNLGFGQKHYLPTHGESAGMMARLKKWNTHSTISIPMGHEISVTMVQMVTAYSTLANGGYLLQPYLEKQMKGPDGELLHKRSRLSFRRVFSKKTCDRVLKTLGQVMVRGTGKKCNSKLYSVGGKTGTTEKIVNGHYEKDKNIASFIGVAPLENPKLVVMVLFDEPKGSSYGGVVSAPIAVKTLEESLQYLGYPVKQRNESLASQ